MPSRFGNKLVTFGCSEVRKSIDEGSALSSVDSNHQDEDKKDSQTVLISYLTLLVGGPSYMDAERVTCPG